VASGVKVVPVAQADRPSAANSVEKFFMAAW
jgi:hypothetical protein